MHSFFIEPGARIGDAVPLSREESAHAARVLRLRKGDVVRLIDGAGAAFSGEIMEISPEETLVSCSQAEPSRESKARVTVYQGLPKAEKLEWIAQKLTELGVARIVPVEMRFSVAKAQKGGQKDERIRRITREAVKQCGRSLCPEVSPPLSFREALDDMRGREALFMPWENARGLTLTGAVSRFPNATDIGILIGPEGGISEEEAEAVIGAGGVAVTLGERILRAETAAIASAAILMALLAERNI